MIDVAEAMSKCIQFGKSATQQRMAIIEELSNSKNSISAYDLLEQVQEKGYAYNISTIYRVLDFWIELGLAHKIESNNTYLVCNDSHHNHFHVLFHCLSCEKVEESCKLSKKAMFPNMKNFKPIENQVVELQGLCKNCF
ncbi:Fur family transcriptional regulator [Candidatus Thioglobus sp.]|uniref:Fur family transcriptional regulator n=1 Tax=Candidatus Thioglobus sp. TaxID=2026721 RepID=UPI00263134A9|nr:Fur family transcriptional regulator [Candidatus Thioglobus sp.]MDG2395454.1 Fur family transcriptional regulator [Candidatus Thioglobus sp.]